MHTLHIGITDPRAQPRDYSATPSFQSHRCIGYSLCINHRATHLCSSVVHPAPPACHRGDRNPVVFHYPRIAYTAAYKNTWPHLPVSDGRLHLHRSAWRQGGAVGRQALGHCVARSFWIDRSVGSGRPGGRSVGRSPFRSIGGCPIGVRVGRSPDRFIGRSLGSSFGMLLVWLVAAILDGVHFHRMEKPTFRQAPLR